MALRHRLSPYRTVNLSSTQKQKNLTSLLYRIEDMISKKIEVLLLIFFNLISNSIYFLYSRNVKNMQVISLIG